jgi:hypothetical protein
MDEGYNITRTEAPKDFGGRLCLNCARTTPELPASSSFLSVRFSRTSRRGSQDISDVQHRIASPRRTMCPRNLSPDHSDLRSLDLALGPVHESDFLSEVELGGIRSFHTLELEQAISS